MALKQDSVHFVLCPKLGNKIEGIILNKTSYMRPQYSHKFPLHQVMMSMLTGIFPSTF